MPQVYNRPFVYYNSFGRIVNKKKIFFHKKQQNPLICFMIEKTAFFMPGCCKEIFCRSRHYAWKAGAINNPDKEIAQKERYTGVFSRGLSAGNSR